MPDTINPRTEPGERDYCLFTIEDTKQEVDSRDLMLFVTDVEVGDPEARRYQVDVPGRDGKLDLTEALGGVYFDNREVRVTLVCVNYTTARFHYASSQLRNLLDGRRVRLTLSDDIGYYWFGRCQVEAERFGPEATRLVVTMDADPHKYSVVSSYEPWKWSPFRFVDGTIIKQKDVVLDDETKSVTLPIDPARLKPTIWLNVGGSGSVGVRTDRESTWHLLRAGKNTIPEVRMSDRTETVLYLRGTGRVGIDYRIGSL